MAFVLARQYSIAAALVMGLTCSVDPRLREFAGTFLTENLATMACSSFAVSLAMFLERKDRLSAAFCGASLTTLVFIRSFYVAWYPVIWICVAIVMFRSRARGGENVRSWMLTLSVFCLTSLALTLPWWIRNCVVLDGRRCDDVHGEAILHGRHMEAGLRRRPIRLPTSSGEIRTHETFRESHSKKNNVCEDLQPRRPGFSTIPTN